MSEASNTFASSSDQYALARPRYPQALYEWIVGECTERKTAWDCATGSGQAAVDLAEYFDEVRATDVSPEQIEQGVGRNNVFYSVAPAERTAFAPSSFNLITVAQALHWFDYGAFWPEVRRVSRRGAFFCAWGYAWFDCEPEVQGRLVSPIRLLLEKFWAQNNAILWRGYRDEEIAFPFERLRAPELFIEALWRPADVLAYMQTWSAYKRAAAVPDVSLALASVVDEAADLIERGDRGPVKMPLAIAAGHVSD